jgi:enoyl-CoA hydratase/carnithine racemase
MVSIAAVEAAALGGGCELILACDLRVAGDGARFGFPEVRVGQFPGTGGTMRLPWLIGESRARELLLTGEPVSAQRAFDIGLVHRLVPAGEALAAAISWAAELARLPRSGIVAVKRSISEGRHGDTAERSAADAQLSESIFQSPEAREGFRAFVEKRTPDYVAPEPQEVE